MIIEAIHNSNYPFKLGKYLFWISIQASSRHYCTPKDDLPDINDYEDVEVGIFLDASDDDELLSKNSCFRFGFPDWLTDCAESELGPTIFTYVPLAKLKEFLRVEHLVLKKVTHKYIL